MGRVSHLQQDSRAATVAGILPPNVQPLEVVLPQELHGRSDGGLAALSSGHHVGECAVNKSLWS